MRAGDLWRTRTLSLQAYNCFFFFIIENKAERFAL
jgi:hypothetical protein